MNMEEMAGMGIVSLVMLLGLIGTCVPGIPGAPLILAGAVGHKLVFGEASASWFALILLFVLTLLSLVLDFLATMLGAKKLGATWRGMAGAIAGGVVGLFFSLPGIILGPIIGAFAFELLSGRAWKESAQAGAGTLVGLILGALGKVICCVIMVAIFFLSSFYNTFNPPKEGEVGVIARVYDTADQKTALLSGSSLTSSGGLAFAGELSEDAGNGLGAAGDTCEAFLASVDFEA